MVALARTPVVIYKIKKGEYLVDIAARYGMGWKLLAKLNDIKPPYSLRGIAQIYVPDVKGSRQDVRIPRFLTYLTRPFYHFLVKFTHRWFRRSVTPSRHPGPAGQRPSSDSGSRPDSGSRLR